MLGLSKSLTIIFIGLLSLWFSPASHASPLEGDWQAVLQAGDQKIPLVIHLKLNDGKWQGTLDTPSQGGFGLPMSKVVVEDSQLVFELSNLSIHYQGSLDSETKIIEGTFIQGMPYDLNFSPKPQRAIAVNSLPSDVVGRWGGHIEIPNSPLLLILHIEEKNGELSATADSPQQGSKGMKVDTIAFQNGELSFTMASLKVEYKGQLDPDFKMIDGLFTQQGQTFPLTLDKKKAR